jgi:hypothetical protein
MTKLPKDRSEIAGHYAATLAQLALLTRAWREAKAIPDPDVFVQAHIAALRRDRLKLKDELNFLIRIRRRVLLKGARFEMAEAKEPHRYLARSRRRKKKTEPEPKIYSKIA